MDPGAIPFWLTFMRLIFGDLGRPTSRRADRTIYNSTVGTLRKRGYTGTGPGGVDNLVVVIYSTGVLCLSSSEFSGSLRPVSAPYDDAEGIGAAYAAAEIVLREVAGRDETATIFSRGDAFVSG